MCADKPLIAWAIHSLNDWNRIAPSFATQWDRTPVARKPKPNPKAPVKRAKVKAARKQRRKQRG